MTQNPRAVLRRLQDSLRAASQKGINVHEEPPDQLHDFNKRKEAYIIKTFRSSRKQLERLLPQLPTATKKQLREALDNFDPDQPQQLYQQLQQVQLQDTQPQTLRFPVDRVPQPLREEVGADVKEVQRCYEAGCYRSAVILCGRLLEVALHRTYYETTGKDILETNPGIGLGSLIAKLKDKDVQFPPGITQQIHLINQTRIFSVHKKQEAFSPSKEQTYAIMLFTADILQKLFKRGAKSF